MPNRPHTKLDLADLHARGVHIDDVSDAQEMPVCDGIERQTTEVSLAERFVKQHGKDVLYCPNTREWFVWDEKRWVRDHDSVRVRKRVSRTVDKLWEEVAAYAQANTRNEHERLTKFVRASSRAAAVQHVISLAAPRCTISVDDLNKDPMLLNCENGTVDLRTGELRDHRRTDRITHLVPYTYDPRATCPRFREFLREITGNDEEVIDLLQRWFGYTLTGSVEEQLMMIFHGSGANGKTALIEAVHGVIGPDLSGPTPPGLLLRARSEPHPTQLMSLKGKRFAFCNEVPRSGEFSEERLKLLTGGDTLTARRMRQDFSEFSPTHKLTLCANHLPRTNDTSDGFWRRVAVVPFKESFRGREDRQLAEALRSEAPGILTFLVEGARLWRKSGLVLPSRVQDAGERYRLHEDPVGRWLADRKARGEAGGTAQALRTDYIAWARREGEEELSPKSLAGQLQNHRWTKSDTRSARGWKPPPGWLSDHEGHGEEPVVCSEEDDDVLPF